MISEVSRPKKVSKLFWALAFFLVVAALIVPNFDFSLQEESPRADAVTDPFDQQVHEFDMHYREYGLTDLDVEQAIEYAPMIKARALADAGSVSAVEVIAAAETIEKYQHQIADQPDEGSRATLRNHRNAEIIENLVHVDQQKAVEAFDGVRADYIDTFDVDPAYMTEVPEP